MTYTAVEIGPVQLDQQRLVDVFVERKPRIHKKVDEIGIVFHEAFGQHFLHSLLLLH